MPRDKGSHADVMDRIYRHQRSIYDLTRKYYLFGRDRLLHCMDIGDGDQVLEVGCGTARNLLCLAQSRPRCRLFGLDASREMLRTAQEKILRSGHANIVLAHCLAEELDYRETFSLDRPFDTIFFSYSLSMIPPWREALKTAMLNLRPGGVVHIVDFWDQARLPAWARRGLQRWLAAFHVRHDPRLVHYLYAIEQNGLGVLQLEPIGPRYALLAQLTVLGSGTCDSIPAPSQVFR